MFNLRRVIDQEFVPYLSRNSVDFFADCKHVGIIVLQLLLGYSKWENFEKVIKKAKEACRNAGGDVENHFPDVRKMVDIGSGSF